MGDDERFDLASDPDFANDLAIDPHALDEEALRQPMLAAKSGRLKAYYKEVYEQAFKRRKVVRSRIIKAVKADNPKITQVLLEAEYRSDPEYIAAEEDVIAAEFEMNMADVAYESFVYQRKSMLEQLVKLHMAGYFSVVRESGDLPEGKRFVDIGAGNRSLESRRQVNKKRKARRKA